MGGQKISRYADLADGTKVPTVAIVDEDGDIVESLGSGGTEYTEGATDATITGTAAMWEDTGDTLRAVSAAKPFPVNIVSGSPSGYTEGDVDASITGTALMWEDAADTLRAVSAAKPLPTEIVAGTISLTGNDYIGHVGGYTPTIRPTITVSVSPDYSVGDVVGGEIALINLMREVNGTGVLGSITLSDATNTKPELDLMFFESNPSGTYTDNAAFPNGDTDNPIRLGFVTILTTNWKTFGDGACVTVPIASIGMFANGTATPYMVIVTRTAINFAATDDLIAAISVLQD